VVSIKIVSRNEEFYKIDELVGEFRS